jgi:hypothetical protein
MKKQLFFPILAATALAGITSCSSEESAVVPGDLATVSLSAQLPSGLSRAYGTGEKVTRLQYAVYESGSKTPLKVCPVTGGVDTLGVTSIAGGVANLNLQLSTGKTYDLVFWADVNDGSPYTFIPSRQSVVADYSHSAYVSNNEELDAFYGSSSITVNGATSGSVQLTRPFAQLNICTTDFEAAKASGFEATHTTVAVTGVCNTLDLKQGLASNSVETVTYAKGAIPGTDCGLTAHSNHTHLAMNYLLVGKEKTTTDVTLTVHHGDVATIGGQYATVPVQQNYRTNIYGALLTNPVDYKVEINAAFGDPDNEYSVWDGVTTTEPNYNEETSQYEVGSAAELAWLADLVNNGTSRAAATPVAFTLTKDIDLCNMPWTPIGCEERPFVGTFDGGNFTIKNLNVNMPDQDYAGLFGHVDGCNQNYNGEFYIKNLKVENATIVGRTYVGVIAGEFYVKPTMENITVTNATVTGGHWVGGLAGYVNGNILNCTVENSAIKGVPFIEGDGYDNGDKVGGIFGFGDADSYTIDGNTVRNVEITGYRDLGGIAGASYHIVTNCVVEKVTLTVDQVTNSYGAKAENVAALVGRNLGGEESTGTVTDVTIKKILQ